MNILRTAVLTSALLTPLAAQGPGGGLEAVHELASMMDKRGEIVPRDIKLTDSRGYDISLDQFFPGDRPVLLNMTWFGCPGLCSTIINNAVDALQQVDLRPGEDYLILTVSIDHKEGARLAADKKSSYLPRFPKVGDGKGWHFAVGDEANIGRLSSATGFRFRYSDAQKQYDHPPTLIFLSPEGKVTTYLNGPYFEPSDVRLALVDASEGKLGTVWDRVQLSCITFDPSTGSFTITAMTIMRIAGLFTVLLLVIMVIMLVRRERRRARGEQAVQPSHT